MKFVIILISFLMLKNSFSSELSIKGNMRIRFETYKNFTEKGLLTENQKSGDSYILHKNIFTIHKKITKKLGIQAGFQDSRIFGEQGHNYYNKEFLQENNPHEDLLELGPSFIEYTGSNTKIILGRQSISLGDSRFLGPGAWKNSGKWIWDALRIDKKFSKTNKWTLFAGKTQLHDPNIFSLEHRHGYAGGGIYGRIDLCNNFSIEPFYIIKKNNKENALYQSLSTYYEGLRLIKKADIKYGNIETDITYSKQNGWQTANNEKYTIDAKAFISKITFIPQNLKKLKMGAEYSFASGNKSDTNLIIEKFDGAFGAVDKYYGRIGMVSFSNMKNIELFSEYKISKKTKIRTEFHNLYLHNTTDSWKMTKQVYPNKDNFLGKELDFEIFHNKTNNLRFSAGLCIFKPSETYRNLHNLSDTLTWSYIQTELKY